MLRTAAEKNRNAQRQVKGLLNFIKGPYEVGDHKFGVVLTLIVVFFFSSDVGSENISYELEGII